MHLDWSSGQSCQPDNEPWLWQGCKPYHNLNSAKLDNKSPLWPTLANNKLQLKENMQFNGSFSTGRFQDSYPPSSHWQGNDDRTLSPYMNDHHYQYGMPAASSAPSTEQYPTSSKDEDSAHDFQLIENLELPAATTLTRSDSAHALGESIDPEMLPDIETLTDPFELPSQLRTETYQQSPAQKAQHSHSSYPVNQLPQQPHASRNSHASYGGPSSQAGSGLLKTGATASSGAASTASDESVDPNLRAKHTAQRHTAAHPFDDLHLAYEQSGSLPLLDVDVDALTDQQAAYMLDENQELWDLMQQDEVAELDTSAALESLDLASSIPHTAHDVSPDTDQAYHSAGWANAGATNQQGLSRRSNANAVTELDLMNAVGKRKGKGGRQPAMDPRLDPNVDPKRAKRILANRLSAARSKMKQKSHVEALRRQISALEAQKKDLKGGMAKVKASCEQKANENEALRAQIKTLEEQCSQRAMMTNHLLQKRSGNMQFNLQHPGAQPAYGVSQMQGPYCDIGSAVERKPRASLPPSSRNSKSRDNPARPAQQLQRLQKQQEQLPVMKAEDASNDGLSLQQFEPSPLKSWGSTGRRQPARPRSKA